MKRLILAALASALAVMLWGFVFWAGGGASVGFSSMTSENERVVQEVLRSELPETGTYVLPDMESGAPVAEWTARHLAGPIAFLHVTQAGADPMSPRIYVLGFFHMFLTALMLGLLMQRTVPAAAGWSARVGFAVVLGVLVAFWSNLSDPIWFYQPWGYHLVTSFYDVAAFAIMGAVLGKLVPGE